MSSRNTYRLADISIVSDWPLPELASAEPMAADRTWHVTRSRRAYPGPDAAWFHQWREPDGRLWLQIGRLNAQYVIRFVQWAAFLIDRPVRQIICHTAAATPDETIRHLLLNQVLPLVDAGPGRIVLHAAAVTRGGNAIGIVGASGAGKSTLCAALGALGCELLTDDALVLQRRATGIIALPTYAGVRLWPDTAQHVSAMQPYPAEPVAHYSPKVRMHVMPLSRRPVPLRQLCILTPQEPSERLSIEPMGPRAAALALTRGQFQLDVEDRVQLENAFAMIADIVSGVGIYRVRLPRRFDELHRCGVELLDALSAA